MLLQDKQQRPILLQIPFLTLTSPVAADVSPCNSVPDNVPYSLVASEAYNITVHIPPYLCKPEVAKCSNDGL